ncbi:MAG: hypothetical protein JSV80_02160 [Acidobacteriota bacterium]|nr:MAG: hypothetical protein JSV80_02160 [Acidobacteriota bacterium]
MIIRFLILAMVLGSLVPSLAADEPAAVPMSLREELSFEIGARRALDATIGDLKVAHFAIERDSASLMEQLLPPRGGQSRYSWLRYVIEVDNPSELTWRLTARLRLLDENGAVIDEFEFRERLRRRRARAIEFRRIVLNYVVPLIDIVELTLVAEP